MLRFGGNVNAKDNEGRTPLAVASAASLVGMVRGFLLNGADMSDREAVLAAIKDSTIKAEAEKAMEKRVEMEPQPDAAQVETLTGMGVNENRAKRAVIYAQLAGEQFTREGMPMDALDTMLEWVSENAEDASLDEEIAFGWRPAPPRRDELGALGLPPMAMAMSPGRRGRGAERQECKVLPFTEREVVRVTKLASPTIESESSDEDDQEVRFVRQQSTTDTADIDTALDKRWDKLTPEERAAAEVLGYEAEAWPQPCKEADDWPEWDDASEKEQAAWQALGLDDDAWPPGSGLFDGFDDDDARNKTWDELLEDEREAAELLGWTQPTFDEDAFTRFVDENYDDLTEAQQEAVDTLGIAEDAWDEMTGELENRDGCVSLLSLALTGCTSSG